MKNIEINNLNFNVGNKDILKDINIKVETGIFTGLIGPNGSGKSSLLKSIYRVVKPSGGTIYFNGKDMHSMSYKETAKKISVLAQQNPFDFDLSVEEYTLLGRTPYKKIFEEDNDEDYKIAHDALKMVEMYEYRYRSFNTLSGGEQQRVNLARVLTQKTSCIILDEPTNHLDIKHQFQILNIVKKLKISTFAALHDLNMAASFCDCLYVLKDGEVVAGGKTEDVITEKMIKDVFEVKSKIIKDDNKMNIIYLQE